MAGQVHLTAEEVKAEKYKDLDPERYDFRWNEDGSCDAFPCLWWDNASYLRYQSDCGDQYDDYSPQESQASSGEVGGEAAR